MSNNTQIEFPLEVYIEIENEPFFIGRITVHAMGTQFHAEIDIVHDETKKIYQHVDILYGLPNSEEAIELSVQKLSSFLNKRV